MQKKTNAGLFDNDRFSQVFEEFNEEEFFKKLHNQVRNKPYFEKYKGFKITINCLSYVFNIGSALTASYAVYWLTQWITGFAIIGYIVSAVFLFFLEQIKRKSSTELWQIWFFKGKLAIGWLGLSLLCLGISLASSGFGVKQGTEELAPDTELLNADSLQTHYEGEIAMLEAKNEDLRNNRNSEGITFYKLADGITANELIIADYRKRVLDLEKKTDGKNEKLTSQYQADVEFTAWTLVSITFLMELLFEACIAYVWYYYYRSYVERRKTRKEQIESVQTETEVHTSAPPNDGLESLETRIKKLEMQTKAIPKNSLNGEYKGLEPQNRQPIGFLTDKGKKSSVQACTDVDRGSDDIYTVPHTYTKGGEQKTVRYTATQVNARIGQYKRDIAQALKDELGEDIIENRREWLQYWQDKKEALEQKLVGVKLN